MTTFADDKCRNCVHQKACRTWEAHGEMNYRDFAYSTETCSCYTTKIYDREFCKKSREIIKTVADVCNRAEQMVVDSESASLLDALHGKRIEIDCGGSRVLKVSISVENKKSKETVLW